MPNPNYVYIDGAAYLPGSATAKKAQQLYDAMPKAAPTATPTFSAPASFPNYAVGTGMGGGFRGGSLGAGGGTMNTMSGSGGGGGGSVGPNLIPATPTSGKGAFGLIPQVPNPVDTAGGSIAGNLANLPDLTKLGTDTTKLNASLGALPYQANLPGYESMIQQASGNISSNLAGVIDPQEWEQLQRRMAERGVSAGIAPDSPNFNTALMTALDQSIHGRQTLGQQELNNAIARTPTGQPFNVAGQQISPADMQAAQYQSNVLGAAPDPAQAAQANLDMMLRAIEAGRLGAVGGTAPVNPPRMGPTAPGYRPMPGGYSSPGGGYGGGGQSYRVMPPTAPGSVPPAQYPLWGQTPTGDPAMEGTPGFESLYPPSDQIGSGWMPQEGGGFGGVYDLGAPADQGSQDQYGYGGAYDFGTPDFTANDQLPSWAGGTDTVDPIDELYAMLGI